MHLYSYFVHLWRSVLGQFPTRAAKTWVHSGKPHWHLLCNAVVSVWAEGTIGRTSLRRIRQNQSFFSTGHNDHAGHARQNLSRSDAVRIFYDFSHRKPLKHCPHVTQRAFDLRFCSSLACGPRAGPHTHCQNLGAFRQTALAVAVQPGGFGMGGGDPRSYFSRSHPPKSIIFFPQATMTMQAAHAKICRVPMLYEFSMIFRTENP